MHRIHYGKSIAAPPEPRHVEYIESSGEHDGTESVDSIWISPQQALDDCYSKKRTIIFPTRLNLEKLSQSNTVEEALEIIAMAI